MTWTRERWARVEALFHEASRHEGAARAAWLDDACVGDGPLRADVERLLAADAAPADRLLDGGVAAALRADDPLLQARFGPFRLVERIADGGMGSVYRAVRQDGDFDQEVAVKVLRLGLATEAMRERFARERRLLARLVHPNVARILDGGTNEHGVPFFAMEYVDGEPIDRACDERRLSVRERVRLFAAVCRAVHFAHQNLVVHLDLKPSNILVDAHGVPKLLDFGVAGLLDAASEAALASTRSRPLTPEYASPEQLRGDPVSTAADVYSLGVVLYELLTGTRPYRPTRSEHDLARSVLETEVPRPSTRFPDAEAATATPQERAERRSASVGEVARALRGDLDRIVAMAMRKEPKHRYASCQEFAADLERFLDGVPVAAREPSLGYRLTRFVQRNKLAVAAAASVLLALVAGLVATLQLADVARAERDATALAKKEVERERDVAAAARAEAERERDATAAAKARIEHEVDHARIEATSNNLIAQFLGDTLLATDVAADAAERQSLVAAIERRVGQYRRQYSGQDHLLANLLDALGRSFGSLGEAQRAEALLQEAMAIRRQHFGPDSLEFALSLGSLGQLYYDLGRVPEALAALREAYRLHRECPPDVHSDVARAANDLAAAERAAGDPVRARELHREALSLRRQGGDPVLVAESLNNLANSEADLQVVAQLLDEARRLRGEVLGEEHPLTVQSVLNLGNLAIRRGDFAAAKQAAQQAASASRALGGQGRAGLAMALRTLAYAELRTGDTAAARAAIDEALALDTTRLGPGHAALAAHLEVLASIEEQDGRWPQALAAWQQVLTVRRATLPAGHRSIARTLCSVGNALVRTGSGEAALQALDESIELHAKAPAPAAGDLAESRVARALALELLGRNDEAERDLLEALAGLVEAKTPAARTAPVHQHLQAFYQRRGRPEDAARHAAGAAGR